MNTRVILILSSVLLILVSCSKDFMDVETEYMSNNRKEELLKESPRSRAAIIAAEIEATYSVLMIEQAAGGHDSFGLKAFQLATDLVGEDMVQTRHHWFGYDYRAQNRNAPYRRTKGIWKVFYKMVSSANDFLEKYFKETPTKEITQLKAEILAIRGIAYFHLVNYYQLTYKGHENKPGVPLILKSNAGKQARATVKEVYAQIIKDLTFAVENGKYTPTNPKDADVKVAAAYLAKTYAAMEDWANVEKYAKIAVEGVNITMPSNFYKADNADVLWASFVNAQNTGIYASFFSHIDNSIDGYTQYAGAFKAISSNLFEQIEYSDARKKWFLDTINKPQKFVDLNLPDYANVKFNSLADFTGDYIYIRAADPYLLLVEALAEQGKLAEAADKLKEFLASRGIPNEVDKHSSDLIDFIRLQRRIELWGEGTSLFDIKRWDMPIKRSLSTNHVIDLTIEHPADSYDLVYQIPQREIEQNDKLVQNP